MKDKTQKEIYGKLRGHLMERNQEKAKDLIETYGISYFQSFREDKMGLLFYCMRYECIKILKMIVGLGWDINEKDDYGNNILIYASDRDVGESLFDFLIQNGADVNHYGDMGFTPFLTALDEGKYWLAKKLYEHGADVNSHIGNRTDVLFLIQHTRENIPIAKEYVDLLLSEPERCEEPLLKKLKEFRLELLYK